MPPPSVTTAPATSSIPIDTSIEIEDEFLKDDSNSEAPGLVDKAESGQDDIPDIPDVVDSDDEDSDFEEDEDEDPNKLWCICQQPHNNRFMICCDSCSGLYTLNTYGFDWGSTKFDNIVYGPVTHGHGSVSSHFCFCLSEWFQMMKKQS